MHIYIYVYIRRDIPPIMANHKHVMETRVILYLNGLPPD